MLKAYGALAVVSIVWGTTYFALRIGVETFPAFLFSAIRQMSAGIILIVILKITGNLKFHKQDFLPQFLIGFLMITLGNGVIGWAERYIPSGLAALIVSVLPLYVVLINYIARFDRRKPNAWIITGLILGTAGIVMIFKDNLKDLAKQEYMWGMIFSFAACMAWALGSIYSKKNVSSNGLMTNAALQMLFGGIVLLFGSFFLDDYNELKTTTMESVWALGYLIVFGSIVAYSCYLYSLEKLPVGIASLYAYINPFVALLLGAYFLNERLTIFTVLALILTLTGVYFINRGYKLSKS